jgi:flagellar biosynthesis protein FlhG
VIAIASGKGGVGKTWFAITLAHALARAGRRTLLFDGDLGLANVDVQLGLAPDRDLGAVLAGRDSLQQAATSFRGGGFDVIAGRSGSGSLASIPANRLFSLTESLLTLAPNYDHAVLDLGAGVDRTVRHFAAHADTCLVVTTDEPTSLTDAYAFIKLLLPQTRQTSIRIVVNLVENKAHGERTYATLRKACESFLHATPPLAGVIRRDSRVKDAIRSQTPLLTRHPNTPAAEDVEDLAQGLLTAT